MKKSLVLAMAMALGVTASAYAANPFSDVPAGHWAYDSIDKLAAAGVIDGMGDGTFQGDRNMTRYEMAQIVAKAMAKGANVDKLAAEFADELDALGVRVAKLEKKADNVKITGNINYWYKSAHGGAMNSLVSSKEVDGKTVYSGGQRDKNWLRSDITIAGQVNEDWKYTAMLRNEHEFQDGQYTSAAGKGEETVVFQRAWIDGRLFGLKVKAGRWNKDMADAVIWSNRIDGIEVAYGKDVKLTLGYAQLANQKGDTPDYSADGKVAYAELDWKVNKALAFDVDYYMFKDAIGSANDFKKAAYVGDADGDGEVLNIGAKIALGKDIKVKGQYLHASDGDEKNGWVAGIDYKGANAAKPGTWGLYAKWIDVGRNIMINDGGYSTYAFGTKGGFHGYEVGGRYAFAKNLTGAVEYYDLKKCEAHDKNQTLLFNLNFRF